jgi:hypothetical protein
MADVRYMKLTREMELEALQTILASQHRTLHLTAGQRRRIARVTEQRLAALAAALSPNGLAPDARLASAPSADHLQDR